MPDRLPDMDVMVSQTKKPDLVALLVMLAMVSLILAVRWYLGALDWADLGDGQLSRGLVLPISDEFSYLSWARQSAEGHAFYFDNYTVLPHQPAYVNPWFLAVGLLAKAMGITVAKTAAVLHIITVAILLPGFVRLARRLGLSSSEARVALLLFCFSDGSATWVTYVLTGEITEVVWRDAIGYTLLLTAPYHCIGLLGVVMVAELTLIASNSIASGARYGGALFGLVVVAAFASASHPYEVLLFVPVFSLVTLANPSRLRSLIPLFAALACGCLPLAYGTYVASQPVWDHFSAATLAMHPTRLQWVYHYGALAGLAALGMLAVLRERRHSRLLIVWGALPVAILIGLAPGYAKVIVSGSAVPLAMLCAIAVVDMPGAMSPFRAWWVGAAVGAALFASAGLYAVDLLRFPDPSIDAKVPEALRRLGDRKSVLTDIESGIVLPAVGGVAVVAGHWTLTPGFFEIRRRIADAGLEPGTCPGTPKSRWQALAHLSAEFAFDYLLVDRRACLADELADLSPIACPGRYCLYDRPH